MILSQFTSAFEELYARIKWQVRSKAFRKCDFQLLRAYAFCSSYRLARRGFTKALIAPPYGHTPLSTFEQIATFAGIKPGMRVVELGCGDGRLVLWLAAALNCTAVGVDSFEPFIRRAKQVACEKASFLRGDLLEAPIESADIIYFYSTGFDSEYLKSLSKHLESAPDGCRLITVSFPIKEIDPLSSFYVKKRRLFAFPWGKGNVYIQVKQPSVPKP